MVNYCKNCGNNLISDDIFCNNCGAKIIYRKSSEKAKSYESTLKSTHSTSKLYRSRTNRRVWGVCGGLGNYFNIDPVIIRIGFILAFLGWGTGLLLYIILTIFIEEEPLYAETQRSKRHHSSHW